MAAGKNVQAAVGYRFTRPSGRASWGRNIVVAVAQRVVMPQQSPTLVSGDIPPLADSYRRRAESGPDLRAVLHPGGAVVLTQGEQAFAAPAGPGGTGPTQRAAEFAHAVRDGGAMELLAWVIATSRDTIISGFAQAAGTMSATRTAGLRTK